MNKLSFFFLVLLLQGCAPIPHGAKVQPEIKGVIKFSGAPAIGALVKRAEMVKKITVGNID